MRFVAPNYILYISELKSLPIKDKIIMFVPVIKGTLHVDTHVHVACIAGWLPLRYMYEISKPTEFLSTCT